MSQIETGILFQLCLTDWLTSDSDVTKNITMCSVRHNDAIIAAHNHPLSRMLPWCSQLT